MDTENRIYAETKPNNRFLSSTGASPDCSTTCSVAQTLDLATRLKGLAQHAIEQKRYSVTVKATQNEVTLPLINILGFNLNDEHEVRRAEANSSAVEDVRADYVLYWNSKPLILFESYAFASKIESCRSDTRTYIAVTPARFAIQTNGIDFKFYSDLEVCGRLDSSPFLVFSFENFAEHHCAAVERFHKSVLDPAAIHFEAQEVRFKNGC